MKVLPREKEAIDRAAVYADPVTFHCFWKGPIKLNEKHLFSIKSCYHFNVKGRANRKIILWVQDVPNCDTMNEIAKYAEIRTFNEPEEKQDTFLEGTEIVYFAHKIPEYVNFYRLLMLYKYGGCWFDIDIAFLQPFDPIFAAFPQDICLYRWEDQKYPNNAVVISLEPRHPKMKENIEYIIKRNKGWGFQRARMTFDQPLHMLILPCAWFDPAWDFKNDPRGKKFDEFFANTASRVSLANFFPGSFCYHWHNRFRRGVQPTSPFRQLVNDLDSQMAGAQH